MLFLLVLGECLIKIMKIKNCFILREMGDFSIVVATGEALQQFNCMITLNESGVMLWKALEKGATKQELLALMLNTYNVEENIAKEHIDQFLAKLDKAEILE